MELKSKRTMKRYRDIFGSLFSKGQKQGDRAYSVAFGTLPKKRREV